MNEEQGIKELRDRRIAYGISQSRLAVASGITREYLNKIESGKMKPSKELLETLHKELILSILVYTFFTRMFDLMLPLVVKCHCEEWHPGASGMLYRHYLRFVHKGQLSYSYP